MLLKSFVQTSLSAQGKPPAWDVSLVLKSLATALYEPLAEVLNKYLAQKILFLLALASAKRIGELHAIAYRISHTRGWESIACSFVPGFVANTQDPSVSDPRFEGFSVPALPREGAEPGGRLLCPVRAVRLYLDRTSVSRPGCCKLFISTGINKKEVTRNTLSFWL